MPFNPENMTIDTVRENMRLYARIVASGTYTEEDIESLIKYTVAYQERMYKQH
jgi:hypothetical protein